MQWGNIPAWVAIAISVVAAIHSWRSGRKAAQASAGAASLEVSLQRIAETLASDSRRPISKSPNTGTAAGQSNVEPPSTGGPRFNIEFVTGHSYRLRNVGSQEATDVSVAVGDFPVELTRQLPTGVDLPPMSSTDAFTVQGSWQSPVPGEVTVTCDEIGQPLTVPLPPRA